MRKASRLAAILILAGLPWTTGVEEVRSQGAPLPAAIATLRIEAGDGEYLAWADNLLAGPVEVRLTSTGGDTLPSSPALPARASVPAGGSTLVARLGASGTGHRGAMQLSLSAVPGSSNARPLDVDYLAPLRGSARIDQGFEGSFSHVDAENRYALDFAVEPGTPVSAARAGTVMQVEDGFRASGLAYGEYAKRANIIRILHDDGTMALYAHLAHAGMSCPSDREPGAIQGATNPRRAASNAASARVPTLNLR